MNVQKLSAMGALWISVNSMIIYGPTQPYTHDQKIYSKNPLNGV